MHQNIEKAIKEITIGVLGAKKSILTIPSQVNDTVEITVDQKARIYVEIQRIMITAGVTPNNLNLGLKELTSDSSRCRAILAVTNDKDIQKAVDIICNLN
ncbi:hypothetical protein [Clostridium coskatii]|uniref:Uncharacterized protein n=1 Tax=Clostridium coskatii TaxID=1705578 RepID=A0A168MWJ0_9CLOT|nr:hypothetical protein [Clostridium coskatii]OAA85400.1 hypothetical protein WX73_03235 [Clostridium coskatii]OBR91374.1 hypothetical protein CLCOS_35230 [Clostridium coskatii]